MPCKSCKFSGLCVRRGQTPLHLAAASAVGVQLIELLLEARAATDVTDLSGPEPQPLSG